MTESKDGQSDQQSSGICESNAPSNDPSTTSPTNSILVKHIRNFRQSSASSSSNPTNLVQNSVNGVRGESSETKFTKWKLTNNRKKKLLKLNSQSNLIFPEKSVLNDKLISNQQVNTIGRLNERTIREENDRSDQKINSNQNSSVEKSTDRTSIPTVQIESISDKLLNPFTLYQMYHQDDLSFKSNQNSNHLTHLEELKQTGTLSGQFEERRSFSSSFGKQFMCSNMFDDNVRTIDFVIVYDCLLYEYGRKFLKNDDNVSIIKQNSEESANTISKIVRPIKTVTDNEQVEASSVNSEPIVKRTRLMSPDNEEYNAELRRLSASDIMEQLDNNQDEEIEYLNTKIIDSISHRSPPGTLSARGSLKNNIRPSEERIEIIDLNEGSNHSLNDLLNETLSGKYSDEKRSSLKLNARQRYLAECCKRFEDNLRAEGLELEYSEAKFVNTDNRKIGFIKIHVPWNIMCRYAELMRLKMPMIAIESNWRLIFDKNDPYSKGKFTSPYSKDKEYLFDIPADKRLFFTPAQKSQIVEFILKRKSFSANVNDTSFGISKLLHERAYIAAYPLHEGILDIKRSKKLNFDYEEEHTQNEMTKSEGALYNFLKENRNSPRVQLFKNWASLKCIFSKQPLDEIRNYYGVKVGLYFAFLGFYTSMLVPASIVGICCFLYGVFTLDYDVPTKQVCNKTFDHLPMCPLCNVKGCDFYYLSDTCSYMKFSYIFDNPATVFFSIFMSFWSTVYLEMWKRYSSRITYRWDLSAFDAFEEFPRVEYLARLTKAEKKKLNLITKVYEPYIPFFRKHLNSVISASVVVLLILVAMASVVGVIIYRVSVRAAIAQIDEKYSSIFTSSTAALINLCCILILNQIYSYVSLYLTELEMPRTQSEFDNSLTLKMYLLQFVNYYSSIFYIAFFKGRFMSHPGEIIDNSKFTSLTQEECGTGGCLLELSIQLAIIMIGKQFVGGLIEMFIPWVQKIIKYWRLKKNDKSQSLINMNQCESDFLLNQWKPQSLFYEYLEMILQFGFLSIFSACFTLGPIFALINNLLEIRLDAKKMITSMRRPVAQRVKNIGIWYRILDIIGKLSVISSALIIAFTSEFIPKLYHFSKYGSLNLYLNHSLSSFNASEIIRIGNKEKFFKHLSPHQPHYCLYQGYRHAPHHNNKYEPTQANWELLAIKLAFVVIFENVIVSTTMLMRFLIPDVPRKLRQKMRQHAYLTNELIVSQEIKRAKQNAH